MEEETSVICKKKTTDLPQATEKLYHIVYRATYGN